MKSGNVNQVIDTNVFHTEFEWRPELVMIWVDHPNTNKMFCLENEMRSFTTSSWNSFRFISYCRIQTDCA